MMLSKIKKRPKIIEIMITELTAAILNSSSIRNSRIIFSKPSYTKNTLFKENCLFNLELGIAYVFKQERMKTQDDVKIVFCKKCYSYLEGKGPILEEYLSLCQLYCSGDPLLFKQNKYGKVNTMFTYLEEKGFIVSTECDPCYVCIKPKGHSCINKRHFICASANLHYDEES